jgi:predicted dehydrogenase
LSKKIRLGIVGLGRVSKSHLPAILELNEIVELKAIVSRDKSKGEIEAVNWPGAKVYTSFDEAIMDPEVDAFVLLLPHDLHSTYSIKAMNRGKHVLIEKPMALNFSEAQAMVNSAEKNHVTLMVGQSRRFFKPVMESIHKVREKAIGEVININAIFLGHMDKPAVEWWKDIDHIGGFIIPLWGSHILDYVLWAYNEMPETVYAQGYSNNPHWNGEDEVVISLRFSRGRMANLLMSFNAGSKATDEDGLTGKRIWSTQNSVYERFIIGSNGLLHLKDEYELVLNGNKISETQKDGTNFTWQMREFVHSILEKRRPMASGQEILGLVRVIDACFESMKTNAVINLKEKP